MSVRVVARVRPRLKAENEKDEILSLHDGSTVKIPNPKSMNQYHSYEFAAAYGQDATQQEMFEAEGKPAVDHLFRGFDVTVSNVDRYGREMLIRVALCLWHDWFGQDLHNARRQIDE